MKQTIRLTEGDLHNLVKNVLFNLNENTETHEAVKKGQTFNLHGLPFDRMINILSKKFKRPKSDFKYDRKSDLIIYNPKKEIISKPEGMSIEQYYKEMVLPNNPEMAQAEAMYNDEVWKPVGDSERYFKGGTIDVGDYYEVSNKGRIRKINLANAAKSKIINAYYGKNRGTQVHLYGLDMATTPLLKYMVANAFLPCPGKGYKLINKDGDILNCSLDNLEWVPKNNGRNSLDESISRAIRKFLK